MRSLFSLISLFVVAQSIQAYFLRMEESNLNNGIDITNYIKNPTFESSHTANTGNYEGWIVERGSGDGNITIGPIGGDGDTFLEKCGYYNAVFESWHRQNWDVWQEIENLPIGMYELEAQGYVRCEVSGYNRGDELGEKHPSPMYLYMNDAKTQFPSVYSEIPAEHGITMNIVEGWTQEEINGNYFPNSMGGAAQCLYGDIYKIKVYNQITNEGDKLRIGVRMDADQGWRQDWWCIWDNFKLIYYGDDPKIVKYALNEALESINFETPMGKSIYNNAKRLVEMANEAIASEDLEAMSQILNDYNDIFDDINNSIALFANLTDAIENNLTGLNVVIRNSMNNKAKEEATALANTILSNVENHNIEDSEVDGLLDQIIAMKDRLNMRCGGIYYNFITKAKLAEVIGNPNDKYTGNIIIPEKVEFEGIVYNVTTILDNAFNGCSGLKMLTISNSVTTIGNSVFSGCSGLTSITIPNSVTSIGRNAFRGCSGLTSVTISNSLTKISDEAFSKCIGLKNVIIPNSVTSIGKDAFLNCRSLTRITIGNSVTSIWNNSFRDCSSLKEVHISDLAAWCNIFFSNDYANPLYCAHHLYLNGDEITELSIPNSVISIGDYAFYGCSGLTSVEISNTVISIGESAFENCESLSYVTIGSRVESIDNSVFRGCKSLRTAIIPDNVKSMAVNVFSDCFSLESVTIGNGITTIQNSTFKNCANLGCVIIGCGCNNIQAKAFADCPELTDVYCYAESVPSTNTNTFTDSYIEFATLHVPSASIGAYKGAAPWSSFLDVVALPYVKYIVDGETYIQDLVMIGTPITPITEPAKEGHTFSGWSEIPETMPKEDVTVTGAFTVNSYVLTYIVDGEVYKTEEFIYGSDITPETEPSKTGYTFSGWGEIPTTMPARDVIVNGSFTINKYKLKYVVDGKVFKTIEAEYDSAITPEIAPTKEGHAFSGWSETPEKMPANDVTITGSFTINKYQVIYYIEGETYATDSIEYASKITPPSAQEREGYTFTWNDYPETMPANDIIIIGVFNINRYMLTYLVDGIEYKTIEMEYNTTVIPEEEPTKEGYSFSGWSEIPETMPDHDVTLTGTFTVNKYTITYTVDNEVYMTDEVDYGSTIMPPSLPIREGYDFTWSEYPTAMPANNITIYGTYTTGVWAIYNNRGCKYYTLDGKLLEKPRRGINILKKSDGTVKKVVVK